MSRDNGKAQRVPRKVYEEELARLQVELARMQYWVRDEGAPRGRPLRGPRRRRKGRRHQADHGADQPALRPHRRARRRRPSASGPQWYFQRYVAHLPAGGEIVLFDRSWYNRAGVERVLGFCTPAEHQLFLRQCPQFERMLIEDGILLIKYWFSVSDEEQLSASRSGSRTERSAGSSRRWTSSRAATTSTTPGEGRDVRPHRPRGVALVRRRGRRQALGAAELHQRTS